VLIIEREAQFRDRVRGEGMQPWGAAEARELGLHQPLIADCAHETRWWTMPEENRDLIETTPSRLGSLNFYHPEMQQRLLNLAVQADVELRRPAAVIGVIPGDPPTIRLRENGREQQITSRLVVGADGRHSKMRGWGDFPVSRDPQCLTIAGILYTDLALPEDAVQFVLNPGVQRLSSLSRSVGSAFAPMSVSVMTAGYPSAAPRITAPFSTCRLRRAPRRNGSTMHGRSDLSLRSTARIAGSISRIAKASC
jgi:2-polyprenyl-6-methoxyphenol hydroxylase-like FAD-dependent oxidoreductase